MLQGLEGRCIKPPRKVAHYPFPRVNESTRNFSSDEIRWDEKAGLRRDAIGSQVIDAPEAQEIKETGNEKD